MARKKTVVRTVTTDDLPEPENPPVDDEPAPLTAEQEAEIDAIEYLLSLGGDTGSRYRVDKLPSNPPKPGEREAYCMDYSRDTLSLSAIRETFGGGTYKITAYGPNSRYAGQRRVTIAELPKAMQPPQSAGPSGDLAAILTAAKGDGAAMSVLMKVLDSQGQMLAALLSKPQPQTGPTTIEILQLIREMKADQPKANEGSAVDLLLKGIELGKEFAGDADGGMLGVASKGLDILRPLVERGATPASAAQPQPQRQALPSPAAVAAQPEPAPIPETDQMLKQLNWLRQQTAVLCSYAARGKNPGLYAEVLLDNLPDFIDADELMKRLSEPNAIAQLAQLNPNVAKYQPWFEELRKAIISFLHEDEPALPGDEGVDRGDP
ncbi:MAG: hypothetical protein ACYDDA_03840 [Acidiferrobacteraceae bacterium]